MLYRNITKKQQWIVSGSIKRRVSPNGTINLNQSDLTHAGSNLRSFELVRAEEIVKKENLAVIESSDIGDPNNKNKDEITENVL